MQFNWISLSVSKKKDIICQSFFYAFILHRFSPWLSLEYSGNNVVTIQPDFSWSGRPYRSVLTITIIISISIIIDRRLEVEGQPMLDMEYWVEHSSSKVDYKTQLKEMFRLHLAGEIVSTEMFGEHRQPGPSSASVAAPDYKTGVVYSLVEAQSRPEHDQRLAERFSTQQQTHCRSHEISTVWLTNIQIALIEPPQHRQVWCMYF